MLEPYINVFTRPRLKSARMLLGFSGWMDGGSVSTGTAGYFIAKLHAQRFAAIDSHKFYIYGLPGSMETSAMLRPHVQIKDGIVSGYKEPAGEFFCAAEQNLVIFRGREPNVAWEEFGDAVFALAAEFGIRSIYFAGSVAGMVPHTRDPRFFGTVSDESLKPLLHKYGLRPSNYEGPSSIVTYLMTRARENGIEMFTIVAEIPSYVQGRNAKCIESTARKLNAILEMRLDLSDLKAWLEQQNIRLD